jgi:hypothetical protein
MARNNNNFIHKKTLITENSVSPDAVFNTDDLIAGQGGLTTGGILSIAVGNNQTFMNYDSDGVRGSLSPKAFAPSPANFGTTGPAPTRATEFVSPIQRISDTGVIQSTFTGDTYVFRDDSIGTGRFNITVPGPIGPGTPSYQGTIPFVTSGDIRVNLNTGPAANQDLINFFGAGAGADSDQIHTYEIYDEVPANTPGSVTLKDDDGVDVNVKLISTTTFGNPLLPYTDKLNTVDLQGSNPSRGRHFVGMSGLTFATGTPEFVYDPTNFTSSRDTKSRFRFRTRKSTPEEITGGATPTYGLDAPEIPLGKGVSIPVFSNLSPKFTFKVRHKIHSQGSIKGYAVGSNSKATYSFVNSARGETGPSLPIGRHENGAGHASTAHGYQSGGAIPGLPGNLEHITITKFPFANDVNSETTVGTLTEDKHNSRGVSSTTHGFTTGGPVGAISIDKFPFATDNNAVSVGNSFGPGIGPIPLIGDFRPSDGVYNHSTVSGPTKGYMAGGENVSTMQHFPYASDNIGNTITSITGFTAPATIDPSNFSVFTGGASGNFQNTIGHNSAIAGYVSELPNSANVGSIHKFPYATEIISQDIATIAGYTSRGGASSSFASGFATGYSPTNQPGSLQKSLRKFSFATDQPAILSYSQGIIVDDDDRSNIQV